MQNLERYRGLFVFVFTMAVMGILGLWLSWVRDTERWNLFSAYCAVMAFIIVRFWNYRPRD